jgi:hypothetical protein
MPETVSNWRGLFRAGGVAALLAALLFRRNIGAEVSLFTGVAAIPQSAAGWFTLLQSNPLVGLAFLAFFDLANYLLVGLMVLALSAALWSSHRNLTAIALSSGMVGIAVSLATNIALTMLSLSQQYAAATSDAQRSALLAAGQAVLALHDPLATYPSTGVFMGVLLIAIAGLLYSVAMLQGHLFGRATALVGIVAGACDLTYCLTVAFAPFLRAPLLAAGGLCWMIWQLLVARRLLQLSKG